MKLNEALIRVGEFGPYQRYLFALYAFGTILYGMYTMDAVPVLGIPSFRCAIPGLANDTYEVQDEAHEALINSTIPSEDSCHVYDQSNNGTEIACSKWVYDRSLFNPSAVIEFNIVCEKLILRSTTNMVYMLAKLIGGVIGGHISDRFGRKIVFCGTALGMGIFKLISGFSPGIYTLMTFRGLQGAFSVAFYQTGFVWAMEFVASNKRQIAGMLPNFFFALGVILVTPFAYFIRNWRHLSFALTGPSAVFLAYWWYTPESPRWLLSKGRGKQAEAVVRKIGKFNKRPLPERPIFTSGLALAQLTDGEEEKNDTVQSVSALEFIKHRTLLLRLIFLSINWAAASCSYYGLSLNSGNLSGDIYINYFITGAIELPAYTFALFVPMKFGRKPAHIFAMILGGVSCILSIFPILFGGPSLFWLVTVFSTIGKFGASISFASIYVYTAELTPTCMRVVTLGVCSMAARIASMLAPYVADLGALVGGPFAKAVPLVTFGAFGLIAGLVSLTFPETLNRPFPETVQEALDLGRSAGFKREVRSPESSPEQTELVHLREEEHEGNGRTEDV